MKKIMLGILFNITLLLGASCPEVNKSTHPYGIETPAFNCYNDNYSFLAKKYGGDPREQNFVRIKKEGGKWSNSISNVKNGDKVYILVYMHNSGKIPAKGVALTLNWANGNIRAAISALNTNPRTISDGAHIQLNRGERLVYKASKVSGKSFLNKTYDATYTNFSFPKFTHDYSYAQTQLFAFEVKKTGK